MNTIKYSNTTLLLAFGCPSCKNGIILPLQEKDKKHKCPNCKEDFLLEFKPLELYDNNEAVLNELNIK